MKIVEMKIYQHFGMRKKLFSAQNVDIGQGKQIMKISVLCPYCHRMRDKSVMYCRYSNSSDWIPSTPSEFAEIDKILKDMDY